MNSICPMVFFRTTDTTDTTDTTIWKPGFKQKCKGHHESQQGNGQSYAQERENKFWRQARQTSFLAGPRRDRIKPRHYNYSLNKREFSRGKPSRYKSDAEEKSVNVSYAGNLTNFVENWRQITSDPWILGLQRVEGYHPKFESEPCQPVLPSQANFFWRPASSY